MKQQYIMPHNWLIVPLLIALIGCVPAEPPDAQRVKEDLIGQKALYPGGTWIFDSLNQFESIELAGEQKSGEILEYQLDLKLVRDGEPFEAKGTVAYVKAGASWEFRAVVLDDLVSLNARAQLVTVKALRNLGTGLLSYMINNESFWAIPRKESPMSSAELRQRLDPQDGPSYLQEIPELDGWGNPLQVWFRPSDWPEHDVLVRSSGSDGRFDSGVLYGEGEFDADDHGRDIVWADGSFLDWPGERY